jgi:hypothetical protein
MAQKNYPMNVPQGATFTRTFEVSIDGTPWNLTGYTAAMQVRQSFDSTVAVLTLTSEDGITIDDTGSFTVLITAEQTNDLDAGSYVYDLELVSADDVVTRILPTAPFNVSPGVTRV